MEAFASAIIKKITSIMLQEREQNVSLVVGVAKDLEELRSNILAIQAVVSDAEQRQLREEYVGYWLDQLKDAFYHLEDALDEWRTLLKLRIERVENRERKVCSFLPSSCFCFKHLDFAHVALRHDIALKIKEMNCRLDSIARQIVMFRFYAIRSIENEYRIHTTPLLDLTDIYGREREKELLISKLLSDGSEKRETFDVISIIGMGGIGKTTLARTVYNSEQLISNFDYRIWVCVSDPFDEYRVARAIAKCLTTSELIPLGLESLLQLIRQYILGKRFLLVLDDVWTDDYRIWEPFYFCLRNGARGSKILVTTRKDSIAQMMQSSEILRVGLWNDDTSWSLFKKIAFLGRSAEECEILEAIGRKIVFKCKGLPLAIKTLGSLLQLKRSREEWQHILDSETWELGEIEVDIFSPLLLSYKDLPSVLKRCFMYCAIFPKDYRIDKEYLIKLWEAQGYLGLEEDEKMEIIGTYYFNTLAARSFFQDFEIDHNGNILSCMMHDLVHDFLLLLGRSEYFCDDVNDPEDEFQYASLNQIRHSRITFGAIASFPASIFGCRQLRSLVIQYNVANCSTISNILPKLLDQLIFLRALDLSGKQWFENLIIEIPRKIGKLMLLRYLNLSLLKIKELPEALCQLCSLERLEISWCTNLKNLPQGMGKLINLRHLKNNGTSLSYMPEGIGRLTRLQTLSEFVVGGSYDGGNACTLESLENLNHLHGSFCIKWLGNVTGVTEASRAKLWNKKNLVFLQLNFENELEEVRVIDEEERVIEALKPPPDLQRLEIRYYRGNTMPLNWMMSLTNLKVLSLHDCMNIEHLPPLGKLSCLESLSIWSLNSVKRVGNEILGIEKDDAPSSSTVAAFPKLSTLKFVDMEEWEQWDCRVIMPSLCSLTLVYCPKLKALPDSVLESGKLEELGINWCPFLKECYDRRTGADRHKIVQIHNVMINFESV